MNTDTKNAVESIKGIVAGYERTNVSMDDFIVKMRGEKLQSIVAYITSLEHQLADATARNKRLAEDYSAYGGSALERADAYIEKLEQQLEAANEFKAEAIGGREIIKIYQDKLAAAERRERAAIALIDRIGVLLNTGDKQDICNAIRQWRGVEGEESK